MTKSAQAAAARAAAARYASRYTMIIPELAGVDAVAKSGLANPKGFIPVDENYRHRQYLNV